MEKDFFGCIYDDKLVWFDKCNIVLYNLYFLIVNNKIYENNDLKIRRLIDSFFGLINLVCD